MIPYNSSNPKDIRRIKGCRSCILSLPCEHFLQGPHIRIRPDVTTCINTPVFATEIHSNTILETLFETIADINDYPQFLDISEARVNLLTNFQTELMKLPTVNMHAKAQIKLITTPIVHNMKPVRFHNNHSTMSGVIIFIIMAAVTLVICIISTIIMTFYLPKRIRKDINTQIISNHPRYNALVQ